ncbi:MAG: DnaJ domain-containing protein [Atopobiaceae bacterium]|nr:DnaJ domain-containing protein [Atopobiaceae bacterium]
MASMDQKDYYKLLGVEEDASSEEIRRAFQKIARTLHPDVNKEPDAEERFKEVSEAYAVLSDDSKRARYDAMRQGGPFAGGYGPSTTVRTGGGRNDGQDDYADFFGGGFGFPFNMGGSYRVARSNAYNPRAGADFVYEVKLDPDTASKGGTRTLTYQRYATCANCSGTGSSASEASMECPTCSGTGYMTIDMQDLLGFGVMRVMCPECEGTGRIVAEPCDECGGTGRVPTAEEIGFEIPKGATDGTVVRIPGRGNAGTNGAASGDFVARVTVPEQRLSRRATMGFGLIGASILFAAASTLGGAFVQMLGIVFMPLLFGIALILGEPGLLSKRGGWWKNGLRTILMGMSNFLPIAFMILMMTTCSRGGRIGW